MIVSRFPNLFSRLGLALAVASLTTAGFIVVMDAVTEGSSIGYDEATLLWLNSHASPLLDSLMTMITYLGFEGVVAGLIIGLIVLVSRRRRYRAVFLLASVGGAAILNVVSKLAFERQRPELWERIVTESSFSFPSGHAMASCSLAIAIIILSWHSRWRYAIWSLMFFYVLAVGVSRMYLGVHYPTDIVGGWLMSIAWVSLVAAVMFRRSKTAAQSKRHKPVL